MPRVAGIGGVFFKAKGDAHVRRSNEEKACL